MTTDYEVNGKFVDADVASEKMYNEMRRYARVKGWGNQPTPTKPELSENPEMAAYRRSLIYGV